MNAPALGRDVAPLGRSLGVTGFARGAPLLGTCLRDLGQMGWIQKIVPESLSKPVGEEHLLIIDPGLRLNPFAVGMLHFLNFTHRIRQLDHLRMGIPSRQNEMHQRRLASNDF